MKALRLPPSIQCEAYRCIYEEFKTWREAKTAALRHAKETGHSIRVEQIRTLLLKAS